MRTEATGGGQAGRGPPARDRRGQRKRRRGWRIWALRGALLLLSPLLFFALLEGVLRVAGYGFDARFFVPAAQQRGRYQTNDRFALRFFAPTLARAPFPASFSDPKPAGTCRIFILGESAARGFPDELFSVGRVLESMLRQHYPATRFEVVNAAVVAINSHTVLPIARDCAQHQPDLFVVYMGNNEVIGPFGPGTVFSRFASSLASIRAGLWLKTWRSGQLMGDLLQRFTRQGGGAPRVWKGLQMFAQNQVAADDPALAGMYGHFRRNLEDICAAGTVAGAKVIVSTVAGNLKDCAPFASLHRRDLARADLMRWEQLVGRGNELAQKGEHALAADAYRQALELDDRHAELRFRLAQSLLALGREKEAREQFVWARDLDALRFRTDSRLNQIIREVAGGKERQGVYLVDAEQSLEERGIAGQELFFEHVHLRFEGNYALARSLFPQVQQALPEAVRRQSAGGDIPSLASCAADLGLTDVARRGQAGDILQLVTAPPFDRQFDAVERRQLLRQEVAGAERRLAEPGALSAAAAVAEAALRRHPEDPWLHANLGNIHLGRRDAEAAVREYRVVAEQFPDAAIPLNWLAWALAHQQGGALEAQQCYNRLLKLSSVREYRLGYAQVLASQSRYPEAVAVLDELRALQGGGEDASLDSLLAQLLMDSGDLTAAEAAARRAANLEPATARFRLRLARILAEKGAGAEAAEHFRAVLELDSDQVEAHVGLADWAQRQGRNQEAIRHCREALEGSPDAAAARYLLGAALLAERQVPQALAELRATLRSHPGHPPAQRLLAWTLATHPDAAVRDAAEALSLARQLVQATGSSASSLDVLAAACAESGNFDQAITAAQQALSQAQARGQTELVGQIRLRLQLYRQRQPYRDGSSTAPLH